MKIDRARGMPNAQIRMTKYLNLTLELCYWSYFRHKLGSSIHTEELRRISDSNHDSPICPPRAAAARSLPDLKRSDALLDSEFRERENSARRIREECNRGKRILSLDGVFKLRKGNHDRVLERLFTSISQLNLRSPAPPRGPTPGICCFSGAPQKTLNLSTK